MKFPFKPLGNKVVLILAESKLASEDCTYDHKVSFKFHFSYPFRVVAVSDQVVSVKPGDIVYCDKERCQKMDYLGRYNIIEDSQIMVDRTDDYDSFPDLTGKYLSPDGVLIKYKIGGI